MPEIISTLDQASQRVFTEIYHHKAMPLLEIAALTGIRGNELTETVKDLQENHLVVVKGADPLEMIVSVSGRYY